MVIDASQGVTSDDLHLLETLWQEQAGGPQLRVTAPSLLVLNKTDVGGEDSAQEAEQQIPAEIRRCFSRVVHTSAMDGTGVGDLTSAMLELAGAPQLSQGAGGWAVNARQAEALSRAREALLLTQESVHGGLPLDFWTIDLRGAAQALGEVNGDEVAEEVLDVVFSKFCIGK
uniref:Trna modification gtpase-like n=1 Tax=Tetraselmis sp. GSL018 TaxID=582737 RepID=A0A061SHG9_9CHLO